jgi:molecular chaperone GrpE
MDEEKRNRDEHVTEPTVPEANESAEIAEGLEEDNVASLRAKLEAKEAEAKANYDLFVRERADVENFKRRMQREQAESVRFANEPLIRDLLPVLDNLERAIGHAQTGGNGQPLVE